MLMRDRPSTAPRADHLDALRGIAVLMMVFSGLVPRRPPLPAWMYHAQIAPPDFVFDPLLPGLTWVDWVFPLFLFAMGVSIPMALSRRLDRALADDLPFAYPRVITGIVRRWLELSAFAIVLQHFRPNHLTAKMTPQIWLLCLLGFGLLTLVYVRWPQGWDWKCKAIGWSAIAILMAILPFRDEAGFDLARQDVILMLLAVSSLFGSLLWLITRSRRSWRLGALALLLALRLSATADGWAAAVWNGSPVPWLFRVEYLQYLFVIVPGTIAGDFLLRYRRSQCDVLEDAPTLSMSRWRWLAIAKLLGLAMLVLLVGLQGRWLVATTLLASVVVGLVLLLLPSESIATPREQFRRSLTRWGAYWLALGLCLEPFQGGIQKDPPTLSYFFITTAMSMFLWVGLAIALEDFAERFGTRRWLGLAIGSGRNPMVAYVAYANLLLPVLSLTKIHPLLVKLTQAPTLAIGRGLIYTLLVGAISVLLLRLAIVWRTG